MVNKFINLMLSLISASNICDSVLRRSLLRRHPVYLALLNTWKTETSLVKLRRGTSSLTHIVAHVSKSKADTCGWMCDVLLSAAGLYILQSYVKHQSCKVKDLPVWNIFVYSKLFRNIFLQNMSFTRIVFYDRKICDLKIF